jgi:DNA ligase (NAD+)
MPERCPECGARVVQEGPFDRCPNGLSCPAQQKQALRHFGSRAALDIRGLGTETVDALVASGLVRSPADLFGLRAEDLVRLARFGAKSAANLIAAIERAKRPELWRFVHALGIPGVGEGTARDLATHFEALEPLMDASEAQLNQAPGVGPVAAAQVGRFFADRDNRAVIAACLRRGLQPVSAERPGRAGPLSNKTVVFTGTLTSMTRDEAEDRAQRLGARVGHAVGPSTDLLVVGERPGSKRERARTLQVAMLDECGFSELVGAAQGVSGR